MSSRHQHARGGAMAAVGLTALPAFARRDRDPQLSALFKAMRRRIDASKSALAAKLGTTSTVIGVLERGDVAALPNDWPGIVRLVNAYGMIAGLDPQPILMRMHPFFLAVHGQSATADANATIVGLAHAESAVDAGAEGEAGALTPTPAAADRAQNAQHVETTAAQSLALPAASDTRPKRRARTLAITAFIAVLAPMLLTGAAYWTIQKQPPALMAALELLPRGPAKVCRKWLNAMMISTAPRYDGMVWINVADPRTRKRDRLNVPAR
ncbi:MAG: hypothetical protein AAFR04_13630 [Pseudomonadota bacterium]